MDKVLTDLSCTEFTEALASKTGVPGSGGATAMAGALAAALASMVANFTEGKKKYAAYEEDVESILDQTEAIRRRLLELVQEDADVFEPLSHAYGIPKDDPRRQAGVGRELVDACKPSSEMMEQIAACIKLLERLWKEGSRVVVSDVGSSALLCRAALECASYNIYANTKLMTDSDQAAKLESRCDELLLTYIPRAEAIAADVMGAIREQY